MQSIGKSLKSAYSICDPLGEDPTYTELSDLMIKTNFGKVEKCDRGLGEHHYHKAFATLLHDKRDEIKNVLEVGIWAGLGLLVWTHYFPNAVVEGIDWKFKWERKIKRLGYDPNRERIHLNWCDTSCAEEVHEHFQKPQFDNYFDVIFDDGNHFGSVQKATLINLWPMLKPGGIYIVEDINDEYENPVKLIDYVNVLAERGHKVGWYEYPSKPQPRPDGTIGANLGSRLIAIHKEE